MEPGSTLIKVIGNNAEPVTGKSGLGMANINNQNLYIGGAVNNPLIIITFTWTGLGGNADWTNPANWTSTALGYPSASTEIAIITSTAGTQPTINTTDNINVYRLTVGAGMTLTMAGNARINVFDAISFTGNTVFSSTSTFTYAQSGGTQTLVDLPYTNLSMSGTAVKRYPVNITITGKYTLNGAAPDVTTNANTFTFAGTGAQDVPPANYYNLKLTGNRGGGMIRLGLPNSSTPAIIDIGNVFDVSSLSGFINPPSTPFPSFTTVNFSSTGSQIISGFRYPFSIENSGNGPRVLDPLGSTNPNNVIYIRDYSRGTGSYDVTGSKINFYSIGTTSSSMVYYLHNHNFNDLEFSGTQLGKKIEIADGNIYIKGKFAVTLTNYIQTLKNTNFVFDGVADQTITGFKSSAATPAFKYPNIVIQGGNRNVTLGGTDTIGITGSLQVPLASSNFISASITVVPFSSGKGFIVDGSTLNFSTGSNIIPLLFPVVPGTKNYENIVVSSGTRNMQSTGMIIGGNLSVGMDSSVATVTSSATLKIGSGGNRILTVRGNLNISGLVTSPITTTQVDMNTGTGGTTTLNLAGNLTISGNGQLMGTTTTGTANGIVVFNGTTPQTYSNTSTTFKNGMVNFTVGDGTLVSNLIMGSSIDLLASATLANMGTLRVRTNSFINCGINNIISNGTGNANFNLNAGATFITDNNGGIEGAATSGTDGTITNDIAKVVKTYHNDANYVFNGATTTPFPTTLTLDTMANLTINANVRLNNTVTATGILDLTASTLTQFANNLQFSGLTSTTGNIYADKSSTLSIRGNLSVGTLRFATGGNITGQFTINRTAATVVSLGSDLIIDKTPLTGNFITISEDDILDINGNTLTINGTTSGSGTLSGSTTSNLMLGNTLPAGTIRGYNSVYNR